MPTERDLERAAEQYIREVNNTNRDIQALITSIREIEQLASAADSLDIRKSFSLKSDLSQLQREVEGLKHNLQTALNELSDTSSKISRALY